MFIVLVDARQIRIVYRASRCKCEIVTTPLKNHCLIFKNKKTICLQKMSQYVKYHFTNWEF